MGGLLPDWSYNSGGISKPSDVAAHWDEVSAHYDMPIDGDVWLTDPLPSSYPPSIAFKAAQLQDAESAPVVGTVMNAAAHVKTNAVAISPSIPHAPKALAFLRVLREMVFLHKKNITKPEVIADAARAVQLDPERLLRDMEGTAKHLFEEDLRVARTSGVRGFPTIILRNAAGASRTIYGAQPYDTTWQSLFATYPTLTAKEYAVLSGTPRERCEELLNALVAAGNLRRFDTKNGSMWSVVR
jgi:protein-disulfide isomerase-like protein with CxxC motif